MTSESRTAHNRPERVKTDEAMPDTAAHTHRWLIERPNGPYSTGRCACGSVREFCNIAPEELPNHPWAVARKRSKEARWGHQRIEKRQTTTISKGGIS